MGFLGFGVKKEVKGVEKDERQKHRFFIFFDVVFRKFMRFVQLNLIYLLFSLPYLFLLYWFSPLNATTLSYVTNAGIGEYINAMPFGDKAAFDVMLRLIFMLSVAIMWGSGPASAGNAYVMRNFAREEHAWVFSDYWEHLKKNFGQSMAVLLIDILMLYLSLTAFNFYSHQYTLSPNNMFLIAQGVLGVILVVYTFMHYYIYQLMVSYEGGIKNLYKNAMMFALAKLPQNILLTLAMLVLIVGMFMLLSVFAFIIFVMFFAAICKFVIEFYTSETVRKAAEMQNAK